MRFLVIFIMCGYVFAMSVSNNPLSDGVYKITSISVDGNTLEIPQKASLNIKDSRIYGNTGCNNYFANFVQNNNASVMISTAGSTKMMCHGDVMKFEDIYLKNLEGMFSTIKDNKNIILENASMKIILTKIN